MTNQRDQLSGLTRTYNMITSQQADPAPLRVAIYVRISEDPAEEQIGISQQEADCRARAEERGWQVVRVYDRDNNTGASTRTTKKRVDYPVMLDAARAGEFDAILGYSNSRLTRRPLELEDLIALHEKHGTRILTIVSGEDDLSTADGRMVARIKASVDAGEAERTGERLKRRQQTNRENGGQHTKRAFGWSLSYVRDDNGGMVLNKWGKPLRLPDPLDPVEGPALKEALRMVREEGTSIAAVARFWNGLGLMTTQGKPWSTTRTRDALIRHRNAGFIVHNGLAVTDDDGNPTGTWTPVCNRQDLDEVRALLNADGNRRGELRGRPAAALLSGIATCGKCGRPMYSGKQKAGAPKGHEWFRVYRCSGSQDKTGDRCFLTIGRDRLDAVATNALLHKQMWTPAHQQRAPEAGRLSALNADLRDLHDSVDRLVNAVVSGALRASDVAPKRAVLEREQEAVQKQIETLLGANAELRMTNELSRDLWTGGKVAIGPTDPDIDALLGVPHNPAVANAADIKARLRTAFNSLDHEQKRAMLRTLAPIRVLPGTVKDRIEIEGSRHGTHSEWEGI